MDSNTALVVGALILGAVVIAVVRMGGKLRLRHEGTELAAERTGNPEARSLGGEGSATISGTKVGGDALADAEGGAARIEGSEVAGNVAARARSIPKG